MKKISPRSVFPERELLYVEDNEENWIVAKLRLGNQFNLVRAANDVEACEQLRSLGNRLAGVLMDIELQGSALSGIDLVRLVRGRHMGELPVYARAMPQLSVPILFVTAHGQTYPRTTLTGAGGDAIISKPVEFRLLNLELMRLNVRALARVV